MYSYFGLEKLLAEKGLTKTSLSLKVGISSRTIAKISKGEKVSNKVLDRIASFLGCNSRDLVREISSNKILQILCDEKEARISNRLYHELQVRMAFNSNHIEGSKLSEEQTRLIFETRTISTNEAVSIDDVIETNNHFRCVDYCIDKANEKLSEDIIKHLHYLLKQGTKDFFLPWFNVGEYKSMPNLIGEIETAKPIEVQEKMAMLLDSYNSKKVVTFDDIVCFHHDFEVIHPFQDGNGRVGRLIALKECLRFNVVPFIIEDSKKYFYYRGLDAWDKDKTYLIEACLDWQDKFKALLEKLDISF